MGSKVRVRVRAAKDRVARDRKCRVRQNFHRHRVRFNRLAAAHFLAHLRIVAEAVRVAVDVRRTVNHQAVRRTADLHAVTVPCVDVRVGDAVNSARRAGRQYNLAAVADHTVVHADLHCRVGRRLHRHLRGVLAVARRLRGHDVVVHVASLGCARRVAPLRGAADRVAVGHAVLVPLVHKAADVRVVDARRQGHHTAVAHIVNGVREGHNRRLVNVHRVRLARSGAAARSVGHNHHVRVRAVAAERLRVALARVHFRVVGSPLVFVGGSLDAVVQVSNKGHVVRTLAHILVAADRHRRHRSNDNRIKINQRGATAAGLVNFHAINISSISCGHCHRDVSVSAICNTIHFDAILIPCISIGFSVNTVCGIGC